MGPLLLLFLASACANGKENVTNFVETTTQLYSKVDGESLTTTTVPPSIENKLEKELNETRELNVTTVTTDQNSASNSKESVDEITTDLVEANTKKMDEENMEEAKNLAELEVDNPEETNPRKREFISNEVTEDLLDNDDFPLELVKNVTLLEDLVNVTKHRGILHGFSESISVILVSEIGDKTFFIAAILAMRNNKLTVFLAAVSALFLMTVLSALLGWVVTTFIPREITYYTCTAIMFAFALKMLWEAWRMGEGEMEETQKEVEQELADLDGQAQPDSERGDADGKSEVSSGADNLGFEGQQPTSANERASSPKSQSPKGSEQGWVNSAIDRGCKENSWFGKKCLKIFKLFVNTFTLTFIAEWGDRSQLATIVLAGINDVVGVILGGCLGHAICTGGAVLAGALIARFISIRKITFLGALVFLGFAIASIFIDPNEDGIDGIPDIQGYDNTTRLVNHNISLTIELEEAESLY